MFSLAGDLLQVNVSCKTPAEELHFAYYIYRNGAVIHKTNYIAESSFSMKLEQEGYYSVQLFVKRRTESYTCSDWFITERLYFGEEPKEMPVSEERKRQVAQEKMMSLYTACLSMGVDIWAQFRKENIRRVGVLSEGYMGVLLSQTARFTGFGSLELYAETPHGEQPYYPNEGEGKANELFFRDFFGTESHNELDVLIYADAYDEERAEKIQQHTKAKVLVLQELLQDHMMQKMVTEPLLELQKNTPGLKVLTCNLPVAERVQNPSEIEKNIGAFWYSYWENCRRGKKDPVFEANGFPAEYTKEVTAYTSLEFRNGISRYVERQGEFVNVVNGFRVTTDTPQEYENTVYLFGPSSVYGFGVDDSNTIASHLQRMLNEKGLSYAVMNCSNIAGTNYDRMMDFVKTFHYREGDIIITAMLGSPRLHEAVRKELPYCDVQKAFDRPHKNGEVFYEQYHLNAVGYRMAAEALMKSIEALPEGAVFMEDGKEEKGAALLDAAEYAELQQYLKLLKKYGAANERKIGAVVMNCNPFTRGHRYLIEEALKQVDHLYLFVVEEDTSDFTFAERWELVQKGTADLKNVTVVPSGSFIISKRTFEAYSNKENLQEETIDASMDVQLFAEKIAPVLGITVRFAGEEPFCNVTKQYNMTMKMLLPQYGIRFCEIPRKAESGNIISASLVRRLLAEGKLEEIRNYVPESTYTFLKNDYKN